MFRHLLRTRCPVMTLVQQLFPAGPEVSIETLLGTVDDGADLYPGDERIAGFLAAVSRELLTPAVRRRHAELASLGFFLRRAELTRIQHRLEGAADPGSGITVLRFPIGLVFHVPPANVDTIFLYSWALSALAGNRNIVRLSPRSGGAAAMVLSALNNALEAANPVVARTQRIIRYSRDEEATAALSAACDLRVIWGGDSAVTELRRQPLAPRARDLTFPDRSSFAVVSARGWASAAPDDRRRAVVAFYNDAYWFDQAACASPRCIVWVGDVPATAVARQEFEALLDDVVTQEQPAVDAAMAVQKRVSTYGLAADGAAGAVRFLRNELATVDVVGRDLPRAWLGTGTFPQARIETLSELVPLLNRRDQTLSHFGFTRDELLGFVKHLGGRAIDRIVPWGAALEFAPVWDGYDLLNEFSRLQTVCP